MSSFDKKRFVLSLVLTVLVAWCACAWASTDPVSLPDIRAKIIQLENVASGKEAEITYEEFPVELELARIDLADYLKLHPDDAEALILSVRLGLISELAEPTTFSPDQEQLPETDPLTAEHEILDKVLAEDPENAEAHYWKARLYGIQLPGVTEDGRMTYEAIDHGKAISHAENAVRLAPDKIEYREALALYLVESHRWEDALDVVNVEEMKKSTIVRLLKDKADFPVPDGALLSKPDSDSFAEMQLTRGRIHDYPQIRVQVYAIPMEPNEIEAFYVKHWPAFKLLGDDSAAPRMQYLRFGPDGLIPTRTMDDVPGPSDNAEGIALILIAVEDEGESPRTTSAGTHLPPDFPTLWSYLVCVNQRSAQ